MRRNVVAALGVGLVVVVASSAFAGGIGLTVTAWLPLFAGEMQTDGIALAIVGGVVGLAMWAFESRLGNMAQFIYFPVGAAMVGSLIAAIPTIVNGLAAATGGLLPV